MSQLDVVMYSLARGCEVAASEAWQQLQFPAPSEATIVQNIPNFSPGYYPSQNAGVGNPSFPDLKWNDMISALINHAITHHACISIQCSRRLSLMRIDPCVVPLTPLLMPYALSQKQSSRLISYGGFLLCILRKMGTAYAAQPHGHDSSDRTVARVFSGLVCRRFFACFCDACLTLETQVCRVKGQAAAAFYIPNVTDRNKWGLPVVSLENAQKPVCARNVWPVMWPPSSLYPIPTATREMPAFNDAAD
jgi:hypothetical protein